MVTVTYILCHTVKTPSRLRSWRQNTTAIARSYKRSSLVLFLAMSALEYRFVPTTRLYRCESS